MPSHVVICLLQAAELRHTLNPEGFASPAADEQQELKEIMETVANIEMVCVCVYCTASLAIVPKKTATIGTRLTTFWQSGKQSLVPDMWFLTCLCCAVWQLSHVRCTLSCKIVDVELVDKIVLYFVSMAGVHGHHRG